MRNCRYLGEHTNAELAKFASLQRTFRRHKHATEDKVSILIQNGDDEETRYAWISITGCEWETHWIGEGVGPNGALANLDEQLSKELKNVEGRDFEEMEVAKAA